MTQTASFDPTALPVRHELAHEIERGWQRLAEPGTWWTGAERLAIAAEARNAPCCGLCQRRRDALSPYKVDGSHASLGALSEPMVEIVHRLVTDAGRLPKTWLRSMNDAGVTEEQYVETIGVIAMITALDTFDLGLGLPRRELPAARPGTPSRHRPAGARRDLAWLATVAPEALTADDPDPYTIHGDKNIHRALSLVAQEVLNFFDLDVELYLKDQQIRDFDHEHRALSHAQIGMLAGRVSALNRCYY